MNQKLGPAMRVVVTMTHSINAAGSYRVGAYSLRSRKAIFVDTDSKKGVMSDAEYRRNTDMNILLIPDPDEWVQKPRIPYVIVLDHSKLEEFSENALNMTGKALREWLELHGIKSAKNFALSDIDYVVCSW